MLQLSPSTSTEISRLDSDQPKDFTRIVRVRSGRANERTQVEVIVAESKTRLRRRRRERRGNRWARGKLDLRFRILEPNSERHSRNGVILLSDGASAGETSQRERIRGRNLTDKQQKIQKSIKGIPFNYFNSVSRMFSRLSVPSQRPYTDYIANALSLENNGNAVALSVLGVSVGLLDLGYTQKDFVVGAKAVFLGNEIIVEPSRTDDQRVDLEGLEPGQGVLMLEYFAMSQRIAHIFTKGPISAENHRKGLGMCVSVCRRLADSAIHLLRTKYDATSVFPQKINPRSSTAITTPVPNSDALRSSFSEMLASTNSGVAQLGVSSSVNNVTTSTAKKPTSVTKPVVVGGKKLSLADLAKGKK